MHALKLTDYEYQKLKDITQRWLKKQKKPIEHKENGPLAPFYATYLRYLEDEIGDFAEMTNEFLLEKAEREA